MTPPRALSITLRTPGETVFEGDVRSLRLPTHTGQVGLRPRTEPTALAFEPGLIMLRTDAGVKYAGTAGGLLHTDGRTARLLTPIAVVGDDLASVSQQLDERLAAPSAEMEARRTLGRLEQRILQEVRESDSGGSSAGR